MKLIKNLILFDTPQQRLNLLPLTYTRPVSEFRCGIFTLSEKWTTRGYKISHLTEDYLSQKYSTLYTQDNLYVNSAAIFSNTLSEDLSKLGMNEKIEQDGVLIALRSSEKLLFGFECSDFKLINSSSQYRLIKNLWDVFGLNGQEIRHDFEWIKSQKKSVEINDKYTAVYGLENIFVEDGANIKAAVLNAEEGPIYIGKNAVVQEGSLIKGPFALCESSHVNMGGKMRGDTTVGPFSKVGGEVSNSVIFGYSNKAHDGFIGNTVIGEWCNLGADTNTSNLKNNYEQVKVWSYAKNGFVNTGLQFCGLIMADHSKCGINTMFNTGTVVGVSANIFGSGFPRNFVPSYAWGGASGFTTFQLNKAYEVAEAVMKRRGKTLDETEKAILKNIFERSTTHRIWDK